MRCAYMALEHVWSLLNWNTGSFFFFSFLVKVIPGILVLKLAGNRGFPVRRSWLQGAPAVVIRLRVPEHGWRLLNLNTGSFVFVLCL